MFKRSIRSEPRVDKSARLRRPSFSRDQTKLSRLRRSLVEAIAPSPIVTLTVGQQRRLFAAHEDILCQSPFFQAACQSNLLDVRTQGPRRITLIDEEPEVFSAILEFLYKGDYCPRLQHDKRHGTWELESPKLEASVFIASVGGEILRDTVIYCAAERYGLEGLKRLALRKQGLQAGIDVATILRSAQYAYANTPDSDSCLRAHYLALIIRCRRTFKRSGTMQAVMEAGGSKLFFDLFVAMCNHLDDVIDVSNRPCPTRAVRVANP